LMLLLLVRVVVKETEWLSGRVLWRQDRM